MIVRRIIVGSLLASGLLAGGCSTDEPGTPSTTGPAVFGGGSSPGTSGTAGQPGTSTTGASMLDASPGATTSDAGSQQPPVMDAGGSTADAGTSGGGDAGSTAPPLDDAGAAPDSAQPDAAAPSPVLPPIDDPAEPGPFDVERVDRVDGLDTHSLFIPSGGDGADRKYPVVVWTNGNGGTLRTLGYASFVEHLASHGFFAIADKASDGSREAEVDSQGAAIDWAIAENERSGGEFFGRLDVERIAVMGHSLGSLASFATASSEHVKTSVHFSGGITDNPVGFDPAWLQEMHRPAAFLCGGSDRTAGPSCEKDFAMAPVPVFYGVLAGASHIGPFASQGGGEYARAGVAWLRWQLADDPSFRSWFVGSDCVLCQAPWSAMQRDLD